MTCMLFLDRCANSEPSSIAQARGESTAPEDCSEECTSKLLCIIIATTCSGVAKAAAGVPPHDGLRALSDTAPGLSGGAHQAPPESPVSGGMDGLRQRRGGTACDPDANRQKTGKRQRPGPPRGGPRLAGGCAARDTALITQKSDHPNKKQTNNIIPTSIFALIRRVSAPSDALIRRQNRSFFLFYTN